MNILTLLINIGIRTIYCTCILIAVAKCLQQCNYLNVCLLGQCNSMDFDTQMTVKACFFMVRTSLVALNLLNISTGVEKMKIATRQYARRQIYWIKNRLLRSKYYSANCHLVFFFYMYLSPKIGLWFRISWIQVNKMLCPMAYLETVNCCPLVHVEGKALDKGHQFYQVSSPEYGVLPCINHQ